VLGLPAWAAPVVTLRFTFAPPAGRGDGIMTVAAGMVLWSWNTTGADVD